MSSLLRFHEYVEAAKLARHRAKSEQNPHEKEILQGIEHSYYRLVEIERWMVGQQQYNRPFAHFGLFSRNDFAMGEGIVSPSADQDGSPRKTTRARARGRPLRAIGATKR